jgi:catechol 2,3-dioxygenase-like lactoylglutathione lyase family enzyme
MAVSVEALMQIVVAVTDLERAKRFYGGLLALEEIERPESFTSPGAWYRVGTTVIQLEGQAQPDPDSRHRFCLWVEDIEGARRTLEGEGVQTEEARPRIPGVRRFSLCDPDGNRLELQGSDGSMWVA